MEKTKIKIGTTVNASITKVWNYWTGSQHMVKWNAASDDWHTPKANNDFKVGGKCLCRMEAKDGSMGFDFEWVYTEIILHKKIASILTDGRIVVVNFEIAGDDIIIEQIFEAENENPLEMQQAGWQAILNNFKMYVESN
ncbi:MAG TPA: SRPBCC domain-containing protein [Bacteroidia bacterium]|nr:SRPBCC domain-containing protein [Bacteroidia bacterium]